MGRKEILTSFLQRVWSDGDAAAVDEFIADSYTIHNDPGDPWDGQTLSRDGFRDRMVTSRATAPDQRFSVVDMVEEGDRVVVCWTWQGTHLGDLPGLPASGRRISMTGLTRYSFEGDRLSGHWQVADRLGVYRQLTAPATDPDHNSGN